ncbi:MAG: EpsG family protein, partial [Flavobacteriaceae bacterium]|nr:EpsG family protein [Flavobacteriaceae bacterium]
MLHPVYYIIMLILTIGSYKEFTTGVRLKQFFVAMCVVMVIIAGIRVGQGADYWPYFDLFIGSNEFVPWNRVFESSMGIEPTYVIISKLCGGLGLPFTVFLLVWAGISIFLKGKTFLDYSPLPVFSLLYFFMPGFFAGDMGHIRQGMATALCIFSFRYIADRKLYKFLICLYFAYLTHKTAMVFVPAYWIANMKISTTKAFLIVLLGFILWP